MSIIALIVAIVAVALSAVNVTWNVLAWLHSGSRVKVEVPRGFLVMQDGAAGSDVISVTVMSVGRISISVTMWGFVTPNGEQIVVPIPAPWLKPVPHTLDPGHQASWHIRTEHFSDEMLSLWRESGKLFGFVRLGNGKRVRSTEALSFDK